jgi:ribose 5-phosphate isomerase B
MREHNDANMIAFGQDFMDIEDVKNRIEIFLKTEFVGNYHQDRINLIKEIENKQK